MDFESRKINNVTTPYLVSFFDGINSYSFYLDDYDNVESMLKTAFKQLLKSKYDQYKIYLHNLSYFDGVFLLNILHSLGSNTYLKILKHEGRFIDLKLSYKAEGSEVKKYYHIYFRDSLLMLPLALSKLASSFNVSSKSLFPIFAVNDLPLNYIGSVPDKKYFKDITLSEYIAYSSNTLFSKYIYDRKLNK
jgi:hypothetical protein